MSNNPLNKTCPNLQFGQAPSTNLTEDIVWMEEKIVADQKVLVPVVYLAKDYEYLKGATITAQKGIDLKTGNFPWIIYENEFFKNHFNTCGNLFDDGLRPGKDHFW